MIKIVLASVVFGAASVFAVPAPGTTNVGPVVGGPCNIVTQPFVCAGQQVLQCDQGKFILQNTCPQGSFCSTIDFECIPNSLSSVFGNPGTTTTSVQSTTSVHTTTSATSVPSTTTCVQTATKTITETKNSTTTETKSVTITKTVASTITKTVTKTKFPHETIVIKIEKGCGHEHDCDCDHDDHTPTFTPTFIHHPTPTPTATATVLGH